MLKRFLPLAAVTALALPAMAAPPGGPTPNEQVGMHVGTTTTNGSAVVVTDRNGTHPEGYPGMALRNRASGDSGASRHHHRRHHRRHATDEPAG
jgi:hypothetical protein